MFWKCFWVLSTERSTEVKNQKKIIVYLGVALQWVYVFHSIVGVFSEVEARQSF